MSSDLFTVILHSLNPEDLTALYILTNLSSFDRRTHHQWLCNILWKNISGYSVKNTNWMFYSDMRRLKTLDNMSAGNSDRNFSKYVSASSLSASFHINLNEQTYFSVRTKHWWSQIEHIFETLSSEGLCNALMLTVHVGGKMGNRTTTPWGEKFWAALGDQRVIMSVGLPS